MRIVLETDNLPLVLDLKSDDAPGGVAVSMYMEGHRSFSDVTQTVAAIISIAAVTAQFLPWFVGKLRKHKVSKVKINGVEIHVDQTTIEAVVKKLLSETGDPGAAVGKDRK